MRSLRVLLPFAFLGLMAGATSYGPRVSAPSVLRRVSVEYSEEAREKGMRGTVVLSLVVNPEGRAEQIRVIRSDEFELGECAMRALARWEIQPGILAGKPVPVNASVEMHLDATQK